MPTRLSPGVACAVMATAALQPVEPYPGSGKPWRCVCTRCGREVTPTLDNVRAGSSCAYCAGKAVDPETATEEMRAAGFEPQASYPGSGNPWPCVCANCGHRSTPTHNSVTSKGTRCKDCGRRRAAKTATLGDELAAGLMRSAGLQPKVSYPGARKPWPCECAECGREVTPTFTNVRGGNAGCQPCSKKAAAAKRRARGEAAALVIVAERGLEPLEPYRGLATPWRCRCLKCGSEVSASYRSLKRQGGCWTCGRAVGQIKQRGPEGIAIIDMRAARLEPLESYPGVMHKWRSTCLGCGAVVSPTLNQIRNGVGGCRACAKYGFNSAKEAFVYLTEHPTLGAVKVGIGATTGGRLDRHRKRGWAVMATVRVPGENAIVIEKAILRWWRKDLALPPFLGEEEMPQGGWTETVDADAIDIPATIERIRALAAVGQAA